MPRYRMQAPDGNTYEIEGPDGASDEQVRAEIIRQNPTLGESTTGGPLTRGRGGNLAEEQAAIDRVTGRQREAPATASPQRRGGSFAGLMMLSNPVMESLMSTASAGVAQLAGTAAQAKRLAQGDRTYQAAREGRRVAGNMTYQPRSPVGQAVNRGVAWPFEKIAEGGNYVQDRLTEAGYPGAGVAANSAIQIAPQAALTVLGMRKNGPASAATPTAPARAGSPGWRAPLPEKPPGMVGNVARRLSYRLPGGAERATRQILEDVVGPEDMRRNVVQRTKFPSQYIEGSKPTAAEAVADLPEGASVAALEQYVARQTGGGTGNPSTLFRRRRMEQAAAREAALAERDAATGPMRRHALAGANVTTGRVQRAATAVRNRFRSMANAMQQKGQFQTTAAEQARRALNRDAPGGPITTRLGLDRPSRSMPPQATGAASRPPPRYTPNAARSSEAAVAAGEMDPIIAARRGEMNAAQGVLDAADAAGVQPLRVDRVVGAIDATLRTPGLRASKVAETALGAVRERLARVVRQDGTVNARDLYTIRKELGNFIESAAKDNANWDKALTGKLERNLQLVIDDAIEKSGGTGWRQYLADYSTRSKAVDADIARSDLAKANARDANVNLADHVEQQMQTGVPTLLDPKSTAINAVMRLLGKRVAPQVTKRLAELHLDPQAFARALEKVPPAQRESVVASLLKNYDGSVTAYGVGAMGNQEANRAVQ